MLSILIHPGSILRGHIIGRRNTVLFPEALAEIRMAAEPDLLSHGGDVPSFNKISRGFLEAVAPDKIVGRDAEQ